MEEKDLTEKPKVKKTQIYKQIALYDPTIKRCKYIKVKISDFESPEELEAYCKNLKEENKQKNAELRKQARREKILQKINKIPPQIKLDEFDVPKESGTDLYSDDRILPSKGVVQPPISSSIHIKLDHRTGNTIAIFGSSKRGKTTLMMKLYKKYFKSKDSINTLFSGNPQLKIYKGDSKLLVTHGFNNHHADYIRLQHYVNVETNNEYKFVNLFDDIIDQKHAPVINNMMLTYRNSNISLIMALQYVYLLSKQNRANVNHIFVFGMNSYEDQKNIVDTILKPYFIEMGILDTDSQIRFFRLVTQDHAFIYIDCQRAQISFHRLSLKK